MFAWERSVQFPSELPYSLNLLPLVLLFFKAYDCSLGTWRLLFYLPR